MSVEIENNSRQVLKRLSKIKNSIMALNPLVEIPNLPANNKLDAEKYDGKSRTNHHPSNILLSKSKISIQQCFLTRMKILNTFFFNFFFLFTGHHEIPSTRCVSVKDFLHHGSNFPSVQM